jgi:3-oxoacyl-[acyl-carrier protein] reductase
MSGQFADSVVVVTGAARGIGESIARTFAAAGAAVAVFDRLAAEAETVAADLRKSGARAQAYAMDIGDRAACAAAIEEATRALGPIDVLVNNAGINKDRRFVNMTDEEWSDVLRVNLTGCFNMSKSVVPAMVDRKRGKIVNISSRALLGNFGQANYSASKAGIVGLTRTLAIELARYGINVNAIAPGFIETGMTAAVPADVRERMLASIPLGRGGTPQDIANVVAFLASESASYITGQVIFVCGGRSLGAAAY